MGPLSRLVIMNCELYFKNTKMDVFSNSGKTVIF